MLLMPLRSQNSTLHAASSACLMTVRCVMRYGSHAILENHFPGLESHGKQQRSWKVLENDDNVMEF